MAAGNPDARTNRPRTPTPMFLNGFGVAHAIFIQAQEPFAILIKGFDRPTAQISGNDAFSVPIQAICYQDGIGTREIGFLKADDQAHLAQPGMRTVRLKVQ